MKNTFTLIDKDSFCTWLDPKDNLELHIGEIGELPAGATLVAVAPTREGAQLAGRWYATANPKVRAVGA